MRGLSSPLSGPPAGLDPPQGGDVSVGAGCSQTAADPPPGGGRSDDESEEDPLRTRRWPETREEAQNKMNTSTLFYNELSLVFLYSN